MGSKPSSDYLPLALTHDLACFFDRCISFIGVSVRDILLIISCGFTAYGKDEAALPTHLALGRGKLYLHHTGNKAIGSTWAGCNVGVLLLCVLFFFKAVKVFKRLASPPV